MANSKAFLNGVFFSLTAVVDLLVVLCTGNGLFVTQEMSGTTQEVISLSMLIAFIITGASNAGIGRTGSVENMISNEPTLHCTPCSSL